MSYRTLFTVNAVLLAIFGALFMLAPQLVLTQFGTEVYVATLFVARLMGSAFLMGGFSLWVLKDIAPAKTQKNMGYFLLAYSIGGFIFSLLGMTSIGVVRSNGWVLLVIFGLFTLLYGYSLFLQPKSSESKPRASRKPKDDSSTNSG